MSEYLVRFSRASGAETPSAERVEAEGIAQALRIFHDKHAGGEWGVRLEAILYDEVFRSFKPYEEFEVDPEGSRLIEATASIEDVLP
jgi:hypothetical protein